MTAIALPRRRPRRPPPMSRLARREASWGLLFVSPWILGFLAFTLLPMLATLIFTFTNINLEQREPLRFIGLDNYSRLLGDGQAWDALWVTLKFTALALPVAVFLPRRSPSCSAIATFGAPDCSVSCSSCRSSSRSWPGC